MIYDMLNNVVVVSLIVGIFAGCLRTILGWLESKEPFDSRLFLLGLMKSSLIGGALAYASTKDPIPLFFEILAVDFSISKISKTITSRQNGVKTE